MHQSRSRKIKTRNVIFSSVAKKENVFESVFSSSFSSSIAVISNVNAKFWIIWLSGFSSTPILQQIPVLHRGDTAAMSHVRSEIEIDSNQD